jgi:hypothetical protein
MEKENVSPLSVLKTMLVDGSIERNVTYKEHVYTFVSLNEEEEVWKDRFVQIDTPLAIASSKRAPILAISLRKIDAKPVIEMFPDLVPMPEKERKFAVAQKLHDEYFSVMKRDYITDLYGLWIMNVEKAEDEAVGKLKNS